jgi:hypothetical protein
LRKIPKPQEQRKEKNSTDLSRIRITSSAMNLKMEDLTRRVSISRGSKRSRSDTPKLSRSNEKLDLHRKEEDSISKTTEGFFNPNKRLTYFGADDSIKIIKTNPPAARSKSPLKVFTINGGGRIR